ncbi:hypothetical protein [uncultured Shewanella sp.]|uniref:hypothetical protein n=1 Tax=uncultured Shewanella sp. TaxID=173975 RepID=UPI00260431F5|nr:hypothetical protein [uncultured Shewanella sp.]
MSTTETADLIESVNELTDTVIGKIEDINERVDTAEQRFNSWKAETSFVQEYYVHYAEMSTDEERDTGNYSLIKLYTIKDAYAAINPWIHLGWTGGNQVGSGHFCSLAQSHAYYTGQQAMFSRRGNGELRFFIDRTEQNNAPVYIALKNQSFNNASLRLSVASYLTLDVEAQGAINLDSWLFDNPNVAEIDLIDVTTQPAV